MLRAVFFALCVACAFFTSAANALLLYPKGQIVGPWFKTKVALNEAVEGGQAQTCDQVASVALVEDIRKALLAIKSEAMSSDGSRTDYSSVGRSATYRAYLGLVQQLGGVSLSQLEPRERKACLINLYNCLIVHAIVGGLLNEKGGTLARMKLYASAAYNIGGSLFSLNDLENGILRGNRRSAVPLTGLPFAEPDDPRRALALDCDARIHFALNCGALGCPPIGVYSADDLDSQLDVATESFLDGSVVLDAPSNTVTLSMLFSWYRQDFGASDADVLAWVRLHASPELRAKLAAFETATAAAGAVPTIAYANYDWRLNSL